MNEEKWRWDFLGYQSVWEGRPVQTWFDGLPEDTQEEIRSLVGHLQNLIASKWRRPEFDPLEGEDGISEIRVPNIRSVRGSITYRIYGFRSPSERFYCFLHGTDKDVTNDREGKRIGRDRLERLRRREATTHKFEFAGGHHSESGEEPSS
jgi:hypothetical protein